MGNPCFQSEDIDQSLPAPGRYLAAVASARWRRSSVGNRMVHVVVIVDGVHPSFERVSDYLVVEGISPRGLSLARSRLVALYRACGLTPEVGEEIRLDGLQGALVEVKLEHERYQGQLKLRIAGYGRPRLEAPSGPDDADRQGHLLPPTGTAGGHHV